MEEALDLMEDSFSQAQLEDLAALSPELQHLHIMLMQSTQAQVRMRHHVCIYNRFVCKEGCANVN